MRKEFLTRHADLLPWENLGLSIAIIGAGAVGSQVALCLAKLGFDDIHVYDFDTVDEENMNCQWYGPEDIGKLKADCLFHQVYRMTGTEINTHARRVEAGSGLEGMPDIVICAVDSMKARAELWDAFGRAAKWWIDPRMSAEEALIYTVNPRDRAECQRYVKTLYSDEESVQESCTAKATMYCAMMLAGHVAKFVKDIAVEDSPSHTVQWNIKQDAYLNYRRT